jgi:hypothetical protein
MASSSAEAAAMATAFENEDDIIMNVESGSDAEDQEPKVDILLDVTVCISAFPNDFLFLVSLILMCLYDRLKRPKMTRKPQF